MMKKHNGRNNKVGWRWKKCVETITSYIRSYRKRSTCDSSLSSNNLGPLLELKMMEACYYTMFCL